MRRAALSALFAFHFSRGLCFAAPPVELCAKFGAVADSGNATKTADEQVQMLKTIRPDHVRKGSDGWEILDNRVWRPFKSGARFQKIDGLNVQGGWAVTDRLHTDEYQGTRELWDLRGPVPVRVPGSEAAIDAELFLVSRWAKSYFVHAECGERVSGNGSYRRQNSNTGTLGPSLVCRCGGPSNRGEPPRPGRPSRIHPRDGVSRNEFRSRIVICRAAICDAQ